MSEYHYDPNYGEPVQYKDLEGGSQKKNNRKFWAVLSGSYLALGILYSILGIIIAWGLITIFK